MRLQNLQPDRRKLLSNHKPFNMQDRPKPSSAKWPDKCFSEEQNLHKEGEQAQEKVGYCERMDFWQLERDTQAILGGNRAKLGY